MTGLKRAFLIALSMLLLSETALAARPYDGLSADRNAKVCRGEPDCIPCLGNALVIEEKDAETGAPVRASLGGASAERVDDTIVVKKENGQTILTFEVRETPADGATFAALAGSVRTLTDICLMNPKDAEVFGGFVRAIVIPKLLEPGLSNDALVSVDRLVSRVPARYYYPSIAVLMGALIGDATVIIIDGN